MSKIILGDTGCKECISHGRDKTHNHMILFRNEETGEEWGSCNRCGNYEVFEKGTTPTPNEKKELSPEELREILDDCLELPQGELTRRLIPKAVSERFECRIGLSQTDGQTPDSYFFPRERDGNIVGYEVKLLDSKKFYYVGSVKEADLFGMAQAQRGDVYNKKLFIFEDPLSCMSGFHVLTAFTNATNIKPACVSLPFGAGSISSVLSRNRDFVNGFEEVVLCMDNDDAGEIALTKGRSLFPHVKFARIPKGAFPYNGVEKEIKDANDMLLSGRGQELFNILKYSAKRESPAGAVTIFDCLDDALKKAEWGK